MGVSENSNPSPTPAGRERAGAPQAERIAQVNSDAPTVGRIVHYFDPNIGGGSRPIPALVVRVFDYGAADGNANGTANLIVFPDGSNDQLFLTANGRSGDSSVWRTSINRETPESKEAGASRWAWPPRDGAR